MRLAPFVWLGSGRAKKRGVGEKGHLLDAAARAGLPVPTGGILLDEAYRLLLAEGVVVQDERVTIPDPGFLHHTLFAAIRFPRMDRLVAVRPTFSSEDQLCLGEKELFPVALGVDLASPDKLAESLAAVWTAAFNRESRQGKGAGYVRRDTLIMEMVDGETSGKAVTRHNRDGDLVTWGTPSGNSTLALPVLRAWQRPDKESPLFAQRLQRLLRGIRRTFGAAGWQITWAHDGEVCWLLTLRPWPEPTGRF